MSEMPKKETTLHFLDYWRVIRSRKEIVLAVLFLVVITGTAYTLHSSENLCRHGTHPGQQRPCGY